MLFFGVLSWLVYRLWRNTKENAKHTERRSRNPSELSSAERTAELVAASHQQSGHRFGRRPAPG